MAAMAAGTLLARDLAAVPQASRFPASGLGRTGSGMAASRLRYRSVVASAELTSQQGSGLTVQETKDAVVITRETLPFAAASATETSVGTPAPAPAQAQGGGGSALPLYVGAAFAAVGVFLALKSSAKPAVAPPPLPAEKLPLLTKPRRAISEAAQKKLSTDFNLAVVDNKFISGVGSALASLGFNKQNSIALVDTCRDEIARPLVTLIEEVYGHSFNIAGLGGMVTCGKLAFQAGLSHSPIHTDAVKGQREKYVFFAFPHVGVDADGAEGLVVREGRAKPSTACGALAAARADILKGAPAPKGPLPEDNVEYGLLKARLINKINEQGGADSNLTLIDVTKVTAQVIREDMEEIISKIVDPAKADYAVITGIQIHTGCSCQSVWTPDHVVDYIAPGAMYAVVNERRYELKTDGKIFYSEPVSEGKAAYATA